MAHYVVTTSTHRDPLHGDSLDDCFCTRGVAELHFEACVEAGYDTVRLVRWSEGQPVELARHQSSRRFGAHPTRFSDEQSVLPTIGTAAFGWMMQKLATGR